jgi:hypothetical protein
MLCLRAEHRWQGCNEFGLSLLGCWRIDDTLCLGGTAIDAQGVNNRLCERQQVCVLNFTFGRLVKCAVQLNRSRPLRVA